MFSTVSLAVCETSNGSRVPPPGISAGGPDMYMELVGTSMLDMLPLVTH